MERVTLSSCDRRRSVREGKNKAVDLSRRADEDEQAIKQGSSLRLRDFAFD